MTTRHNSGLCGTEENNYIITIKLKTLEDFIRGMKKIKLICDLIKDRNFDMARAELNEFNKLIPNNPLYYYNSACIDSLMHKKEECLNNLKTALMLNGNLVEELKVDRDFDLMLDDVDFINLLHDYNEG